MERNMDLKKTVYLKFHRLQELSANMAKIIAGFLFVSILTGACSQVPDFANPAEWYRGTLDYFSDCLRI